VKRLSPTAERLVVGFIFSWLLLILYAFLNLTAWYDFPSCVSAILNGAFVSLVTVGFFWYVGFGLRLTRLWSYWLRMGHWVLIGTIIGAFFMIFGKEIGFPIVWPSYCVAIFTVVNWPGKQGDRLSYPPKSSGDRC
jgi:hypothetical protein